MHDGHDIVAIPQDPLGEEKSGCQIEVISGGPHGHGHATAREPDLECVVLRWIADQVLRLTSFAHGAHSLAQRPAQQGNSDIRACKVFQSMDGDAALTFLRFHVVGLALFVLERPIPQLAGPDVRNGVRARFPLHPNLWVDHFCAQTCNRDGQFDL